MSTLKASGAYKASQAIYLRSLTETKAVDENSSNAELYHLGVFACEAERGDLALEAIALIKKRLGTELVLTHPHRLAVNLLYVECLRQAERVDEAEEETNSYIETVERELGKDHSEAIMGRLELAKIYEARGNFEAARSTCVDAWKHAESLGRPDALVVSLILRELIRLHEESGLESDVQLWRAKLEAAVFYKEPHNLDLEAGEVNASPDGWRPALSGSRIADMQWTTTQGAFEGRKCVVLSTLEGASRLGSATGARNMMQTFEARPYHGKKIRFSAAVRVEGDDEFDRAHLWLRADRPGNAEPNLLENMADRPIRSPDWQRYEIVGDVDKDAESLNIGIIVFGEATAWLDDVRFEIVDETTTR